MFLQIMNKAAFIEISVVTCAIWGIVLVLKNKRLSPLAKVIWLFFVMTFNFIAVICFLLWRRWDRNPAGPADSF